MNRIFSLRSREDVKRRREERREKIQDHHTALCRVLIIGFHGLRAAHYCFSHENIASLCVCIGTHLRFQRKSFDKVPFMEAIL